LPRNSHFPIHDAQLLKLKQHGLEEVAQDEFSCIPITADMELTGINLNEKILRTVISWFQMRQNEIPLEVQKIYGKELQAKNKKAWRFLAGKSQVEMVRIVAEGEEWEGVGWYFDIESDKAKLSALQYLGYQIKNVRQDRFTVSGT
jgi:hypothetical protein